MAVSYEQLMAIRADDVPFSYNEKDTMLYALATGMGRDPLNTNELPFVFEGAGLKALPTLCGVVSRTNLLLDVGLDRTKVLHGEQSITLHRPMQVSGELRASSRVVEVYDKGPGKGSVIHLETIARDASTGEEIYTLHQSTFARGDGGIGGRTESAPAPSPVPQREPDRIMHTETRQDQALLYRLTGDRNPIHADPARAAKGGFDRPILHGMCTFAIVANQILSEVCDYDSERIKSYGARFSAPVFPGETITTHLWQDGASLRFQSFVKSREAKVMDFGFCSLWEAGQ